MVRPHWSEALRQKSNRSEVRLLSDRILGRFCRSRLESPHATFLHHLIFRTCEKKPRDRPCCFNRVLGCHRTARNAVGGS